MGGASCGWRVVSGLVIFVVLGSATVTTRQKHEDFSQKVSQDHNKDGHHNKDFDNDVIWGDGKTSEDDDDDSSDDDVENLSPDEKKRRLRLLVQERIDKDKDGFVSLEELTDWTERSYDLFEMEETKELFPDLDRDKDGVIKWTEYVENNYGADFSEDSEEFKNPQSVEWEEFVNTYRREKKKFEAADLDGNAELDLNEYLLFKHPRRHPKTEQLIIDETLDSSDLNKDGKIDVDEFLGDFEKKEGDDDPHWALMEREKFEAELDIDKDGFLSGNEILQWVSPSNRALAIEEAEHLMDETDLDSDDRLTADEIVNNHADWVDSDATDYGRQLLKNHDEL